MGGAPDYASRGDEIKESVELAPHEYCLISCVNAATHSFNRPRKHHKLLCFVKERDEDADHWKPVVPEVIWNSAVLRSGRKAAQDYQASRIVLASFVYKHIGKGEDSEDEEVVTDTLCAPTYSQRMNMILGPRGVHNPGSFPADPDGNHRATRLTFGDDEHEMNSGATWTIFGVIGPAAKVLEYARGIA
jgi:hypothetical protein